MEWKFKNDRPVYIQLIEQLELRIISGIYKTGEKMPGVRELALEAQVNPNTMQRAFSELEELEIVVTQRTAGRFITTDKEKINELRKQIVSRYALEFLEIMTQYGYSKEEAINIIKETDVNV